MPTLEQRADMRGLRHAAAALMAVLSLWMFNTASASAPPRNTDAFKLTEWRADQGAPPDIASISQSPDGFLWLGTSSGLYRFDGITFEKIPPIPGDRSRSQQITSVLAARDGAVWVGHYWGGMSVYREGAMKDANPSPASGTVWKVLEAPDGSIWVAKSGHSGAQISRFDGKKWSDAGVTKGLQTGDFVDLKFERDGTLWVLLTDRTFAVLRPGASRYRILSGENEGSSLAEDPDGHLWVVGLKGAAQVPSLTSPSTNLPTAGTILSHYGPCSTFDRDGNLFICRPDHTFAVLKFPLPKANAPPKKVSTTIAETLKSTVDQPLTLFEDREGNTWVGTSGGLIQIRATNVRVDNLHSTPSGNGWLATSSDHKIYFADGTNLNQVQSNDTFRTLATLGSASDPIDIICPDRRGGIWAALAKSIYHWNSGHFIPVKSDPRWSNNLIYGCAVDAANDLWVSIGRLGLFWLHEGAWRRIEADPAHPGGWPTYMTADHQGRILVFHGRNIFRVSGSSVENIGSMADFGVGYIRTIYPQGSYILIGGDDGLSRYSKGRFQLITSDRRPWLTSVSAILQSGTGDTWLYGAQGIVRLRTIDLDHAFSQPNWEIPHQVFDLNDGLPGSVAAVADYDGALGSDGRVWFQSTNGLSSIDPAHLRHNAIAPTVVIKSITAENHAYAAADSLVLPPGVTSAQIDYTALTLTVPGRAVFRYRLHGVDRDWVDPGTRRQAFYTNLGPGRYRFDVIAANNDGVWNERGASTSFQIKPTFWQTPLFIAIVLVAIFGLIWLLYSLRLRDMARRIRLRLEDRVAERERIARELHDTLLQGFQGLIMRFQSVAEQIPSSEPTRRLLDRALDRADEVLVEGRDRVRNLRASEGQGELAFLIEAAAYKLRPDPEIDIRMVVEGDCKPAHPVVREELVAIANEALFNAYKHAKASQISINLSCEEKDLRLRISDNGIGIDPTILAIASRPGHFGLLGMRERAKRLKAKLIISNQDIGADVLVIVPKRIAYSGAQRRWSPLPQVPGSEF